MDRRGEKVTHTKAHNRALLVLPLRRLLAPPSPLVAGFEGAAVTTLRPTVGDCPLWLAANNTGNGHNPG